MGVLKSVDTLGCRWLWWWYQRVSCIDTYQGDAQWHTEHKPEYLTGYSLCMQLYQQL
jgi:hypothetical protein